MSEVYSIYESVAAEFDRNRATSLLERPYLEQVLSRLNDRPRVLDLGCGTSEPIARFFVAAGCDVTGVDAAPAMLRICRDRFPEMTWIEQDMRALDLDMRFDAIVAWDSFFHLDQDDQRKMFPIFAKHMAPGGILLFTSGPSAGVSMGNIFGHELFHASLDPNEYEQLLGSCAFDVLLHRTEDPNCGGHTVWLAQRRNGLHG